MSNDIEWETGNAVPSTPASSTSDKIEWETGNQVASKPRTFTENLMRQAGLTARAGIDISTMTPLAVADFVTGAKGVITGKHSKAPSKIAQELMTSELGLPEEETGLEKLVGFGTRMAGGAMEPSIMALQKGLSKLVPEAFSIARVPAKTQVTKELRDAGYKNLPSTIEAGGTARTAEGFAEANRLAALNQLKNQQVTQKWATKELGFPPNTPLTKQVLKAQADSLLEEGYKPLRSVNNLPLNGKYFRDLAQIRNDLSTSKSFPGAKDEGVDTLVQQFTTFDPLKGLYISGEDAFQQIKNLRKGATGDYNAGRTSIAEAKRRIADVIEDTVEAGLKRRGKPGAAILAKFRDTREALAKNHAVDRMLVDQNSGIVSATKAHELLEANVPLTGRLLTIAKAGSPVYRASTAPPLRGYPDPVDVSNRGFGNTLFGAATAPFRSFTRSVLASEPAQNTMVRGLFDQEMGPNTQRMIGAMPPELLQLFNENPQ